jgi:hypothetical protein
VGNGISRSRCTDLSAPWCIVYVIATQLDILARDTRSVTLFVEFKHIGSHRRETDVGPELSSPLVHCLCNCNTTRHPSKRYMVSHIVRRVQTYWIASERDKCWTPSYRPLVHCLCNCNTTQHPSKRYTVGHIVRRVQTYWITSERDRCWTPIYRPLGALFM